MGVAIRALVPHRAAQSAAAAWDDKEGEGMMFWWFIGGIAVGAAAIYAGFIVAFLKSRP